MQIGSEKKYHNTQRKQVLVYNLFCKTHKIFRKNM